MAGQIDYDVTRQRMTRMLEVARQSKHQFERQHLGTEVEVLWERRKAGSWRGTTDNYITVQRKSDEPLSNQLRREWLATLTAEGVLCQPEHAMSHVLRGSPSAGERGQRAAPTS